jgi:prepilin-type N-terminal cleavage/methylation domain-containing protein
VQKQKGFTLVELSISVTIIGLLLAGITSGMSLYHESQIRKAVTEFTNFRQAIDEFEKEYQYLPGDLPTASGFWSGAHNGDGNSSVNLTGVVGVREDLFAWEHLGKAGLIKGLYTGVPNPSASGNVGYVIGENAPGSQGIDGAVFLFESFATTQLYGTNGTAIRMGGVSATNPYTGFMNAKDAYSIDKKLDDGNASAGMFMALEATSGSCVDAVWTGASANYVLTGTTKACQLVYWYKKS